MDKTNLTFTDGFQFGCGFFVAGLVYTVIMSLVFFIFIFVFSSAITGMGRMMF
jgi:hypothetical protein